MKTTEENNKLIAKFMGFKPFTKSIDETPIYNIPSEKSIGYVPNSMKYHASWNWLMPVVREIKDVDTKFKLKHLDAFVSWEHRFKESLYIGIDNTYRTVVEFIKWYNQQK